MNTLKTILMAFMAIAFCAEVNAQCPTDGIFITEFVYDVCNSSALGDGTAGTGGWGEYIILTNTSATDIDISNATIDDVAPPVSGGTVPVGTIVPAGGCVILAQNTQAAWESEYGPVSATGCTFVETTGSWPSLNNGGDMIGVTGACNNGTYGDLVGDGEAIVWNATTMMFEAGPAVSINPDCATVACAIAADLMTAPAAPVVIESTCQADGTTVDGGVVDPITCPTGATAEYSIDGGTTWTTTVPMYDQTTAITVTVRCLCDEDMVTASPTAEVTTVPGMCTVCEITDISAAAPVCSADGLTYTVTVTVTGVDANNTVTLDDAGSTEVSQAATGTVIFTYADDASYNITVTDTDAECTFPAITGGPINCTVLSCGTCTEGSAGLVITELSYDPSGTQGNDGDCEYIEIFNSYSNTITTDASTTVILSGGTSVTLPAGTTIAPGEYIILTGPNFAGCTWATPPPAGTQIIDLGVAGTLGNGGEDVTITLTCADDATAGNTQTVTWSDATTPTAGGGGDAVYYPLDGTGPLASAPTPGSGDCTGCAMTEFLCEVPVACPATQVIPGSVIEVCTLGNEIADWKANVEQTDGTGAVTTPAVAPATTSIVYSMTTGYTSADFPSSGWDPEPTGAHSGTGCFDETQTTSAYVICDLTGDGETSDDVVTNVGLIAMVYFAPAQAPTITNDATCAYAYTAACAGDVFAPATIPNAAPGEDPAPFDVMVTTANGCVATFSVDPAACPMDMTCAITDLVVTPTACDPTDDTYSLDIAFTVTDPGASGMFNVDVCGTAYGPFAYSALPLNIPGLPADGTVGCTVTVTDVDNAGGGVTPAMALYVSFVPDGSGAGGGIDECATESVTVHNFSTDAAGCVDVDISGYQLQDNNGVFYTFPAGTVVPAGGSFSITIDQINACSGTVGAGDGGGAQFANGNDNADLLDAAGAMVDATGTVGGDPGVEYESPALTAAGGTGSAMCTSDACSAAMPYDAPASCLAQCPVVNTPITGVAYVCDDDVPFLDNSNLMVDDETLAAPAGPTITISWWTDMALTIPFSGTADYAMTDGDGCFIANMTLYASIECAADNTIIPAGDILLSIHPPYDASLVTINSADCALPTIESSCGSYEIIPAANPPAPTPGTMATFNYTIEYFGVYGLSCFSETLSVVVNCPAAGCPSVIPVDATDAVCDGSLAGEITTWQGSIEADATNTAAIADANTDAAVIYSTDAPAAVSEATPPTAGTATGVHSGADLCAAETEMTFAYLLCFGDDGVAGGGDDSYLALGMHTLSVYPLSQAPTIVDDPATCIVTITSACANDVLSQGNLDYNGAMAGALDVIGATAQNEFGCPTVTYDVTHGDCTVPGCTFVLSPATTTCDAETAGTDTYTVTIPFDNGAEGFPGGMNYVVTTSGTLGGDNPMIAQSGTITITFNEGSPYDYSIQGTSGNPNELCDFSISGASPTCDPMVCEDEIAGMVVADASCDLTGITVTITDAMGNVITMLTTDAAGIYDSSPAVFPCGDYFAELTAGVPACYGDGETGPKAFAIDGDPTMGDTDGPNFGTIADIPTVGEWGLIILALLMSIVAVVGIRERKASEVNA